MKLIWLRGAVERGLKRGMGPNDAAKTLPGSQQQHVQTGEGPWGNFIFFFLAW